MGQRPQATRGLIGSEGETMKKVSPPTTDSEWFDKFLAEQPPPDAGAPSFRPTPSRSERKAEESTRVAREVIEAATEQRESATALLRGARLKWEADARALAAKEPNKKRKPGTTD
jgi:hypothetical protein